MLKLLDIWYTYIFYTDFCYRFTSKKTTQATATYAIVLDWPKTNQLVLGAPAASTTTVVTMLGYQGNFSWKPNSSGGIVIQIPVIPFDKIPCQDAWVFKLTGLKN